MVVFEGLQGIGKNRMLEIIFGRHLVVSTPHAPLGSKDFEQACADAWCVHDDELAALSRAGLENMKGWLTGRDAKYRPAYERDFVIAPRRFVVVGSTNRRDYLTDEENRRILPVRGRRLDVEWLEANREQLWGEAVAYFRAGALRTIEKSDPLWGVLEATHQEKRAEDPLEQKLHALITCSPPKLIAPFQLFQAIEALGYHPDRLGEKRIQALVSNALHGLGYVRTRRRVGNKHPWVWDTPNSGVYDGSGDSAPN